MSSSLYAEKNGGDVAGMNAIVCREYGSAAIEERDRPSVPDGAVLVRVRAGALNAFDWFLAMGRPYFARLMAGGVRRPRVHVVGVEFAGTVEAVGGGVTDFQPGDDVFGVARASLAEYVAVPIARIARKPSRVSFEEAAGVPMAGLTALQGLRKGGVARGQRVLINGASGGIGTFAVQLAKHFGAEVTGVCSGRNVELVRSIGADRVIDYTREDFARERRYDLMLDIIGNRSWRDCGRTLKPGGTFVMAGGDWHNRWIGPLRRLVSLRLASTLGGPRLVNYVTRYNTADLVFLAELMERGALNPVIDRRYTMTEALDALLHLGTGRARGKVVITVR
jgi:NADPH:quinone reductase-like Zn-dependent oxidoreductase